MVLPKATPPLEGRQGPQLRCFENLKAEQVALAHLIALLRTRALYSHRARCKKASGRSGTTEPNNRTRVSGGSSY